MPFVAEMRSAAKQINALPSEPWLKTISKAVENIQAISTVGLLNIVGAPHTKANGRRMAVVMRELGFIAVQNRQLEPGGHRGTAARGWTRPLRKPITFK